MKQLAPEDLRPGEGACVPYALSLLLEKGYLATCNQIYSLGALTHHSVPMKYIEKIVKEEVGIKSWKVYRRPPLLSKWMDDKINGTWLVITCRPPSPGSHLLIVKRRRVYDNHSPDGGGYADLSYNYNGKARVLITWEIEKNVTHLGTYMPQLRM